MTATTQTPAPYGYYDVIIIGAGASGLYCAITAGARGRRVLVIDHANKAGKKILMSGGGRCNFTNYIIEPEHFIGTNPHFCKSALSRYSNWEFIALVAKHGIAYHERDHGQLFCDHSSKDIVAMLLAECEHVSANIRLNTDIHSVAALESEAAEGITANFLIDTSAGHYSCQSLVVATGGLSIPTMGASGLGYQIATQFGHHIRQTDASLVPFTFTNQIGDLIKSLAGISLPVIAFNNRATFRLPMLFTHRGLSGPAILQLSNYWYSGECIHINLLPDLNAAEALLAHKLAHPKQRIRTLLANYFPKKLLAALQAHFWEDIKDTELANIKDDRLIALGETLNNWVLKPSGTEGYRTAEVTRGGIDTEAISSKTMESQLQPNLYFIGEVLDITGWLGGYNFQWAWASGFVCGEVV